MLFRYIVLSLFMLTMTFGCKVNTNNSGNFAYIGGEIINPKNSSVILYNTKGKVLDSVTLDSNNRFVYKIEDLHPGLHSFTHGGEYQLILLEPNDSVMFRLNTYDFDESLVFTGEGARKNNYLIETYLANEQQAKKLVHYAKMEPEEFNAFIDERRNKELIKFQNFLLDREESELFKSIIETNINYNSYADKEIYPFAYFGNNKLIHIKDLPEDFYEHRKSVDYNATHLSHLYAYNRFLFSHIDNLAAQNYYEQHNFHSAFDRHAMEYNKSKLDLIDSIISDETIKNNLLKYKTRDFVSYNHTEAEADEILNHYLPKSTNEEDKESIKELVCSLKLLRQGNPIPNLEIVNYDNTEHNLNSIIDKPTIIYFWSSNSKMQYRNSHYKVKSLKNVFPQVEFVSINLNSNDDKSWKSIINNYDFPTENEYKFKYPTKARKVLAVNYLNKAIIVNENGMILHPNVNIFKSDFSEMLGDLLQKRHLIAQQ
ncbi:MAG: TlpA family protein disulfide reductase [Winogradskyella sp.]